MYGVATNTWLSVPRLDGVEAISIIDLEKGVAAEARRCRGAPTY
jgi:hypothetical protein